MDWCRRSPGHSYLAAPCVFLLLFCFVHPALGVIEERACIGTNGRFSVPNRDHHYINLRERYTNCTYVDGNLELTWLLEEDLDLSFLQYIREVAGYVLIFHVNVKKIVLPRLQIIRGRMLFKVNKHEQEFALYAALSKMHSLEMPALRDILLGSVGMENNNNLCHVKTINWEEIITGPNAMYLYIYTIPIPERECSPCHPSCEAGCWGEGPENCQRFSKINCSTQCYPGRCFGAKPQECCHPFCAGGCTGPKQSDCLACKNFYDDGVCKQECPAMQHPTKYSWEINQNGKYAYGATCVKNCPKHLLKDNGTCVRSCPKKKMAVNGECVPCDGPCPKTCEGVKVLHAGNIESFRDCTAIEGSVTILDKSFKGFQVVNANFTFGPRYPPMHPDRLEVFITLKEVAGHVNIQASHEAFTNLSYFENLEVIGGRDLTEYFASLYIVRTSLKSLGLCSLKKIHSGSIAILENKDLCFAEGIDWDKIKKSHNNPTYFQSNKPEKDCKAEGLVCDSQCSLEGCWGLGPDQCLTCGNYQVENICLESCDTVAGMYKAGPKLCMHCHEECESTCYGPGPGNCTRCKHVKDGPFCTVACPSSKYNDGGECKPCHDNCVHGCTGPLNTIGTLGCNSCEMATISGDISVAVNGEIVPCDGPCPKTYEGVKKLHAIDFTFGPRYQLPHKVCIGTNGRFSVPSNRDHHYMNLRERYTNCTYVDGNLELTWLLEEDLDLSFLQYIREVAGYILIFHMNVKKIVLPRLQIIRGRMLFKVNKHEQEFALYAALSKMDSLEMPALRDILLGSVGMENNNNLCHVKTINWEEIITGPNAMYLYIYTIPIPERECSPCHPSCEAGCWGEGPENCQRFSKINCSTQCYPGRCFGAKPQECCHPFCAGGCTGPNQSDCLACKNFYDDGVCKQECPAMQHPTKYSWEINQNGKYAYGATCVKNCPKHLLKDNGTCVRSCPKKKMAVNGECVPCDGPCPKTCEGVKVLHAGNIESFRDCTAIEGSVTILDKSFKGFQVVNANFTFGPRYPPMHPDRLEVFITLKEVAGHVNIQASHEAFTNLSYFENLEVIGGRDLTEYFASLYIVRTSLKSLGLCSLKKIHSGSIAILENKDLCYAEGIDWDKIKKSHNNPTYFQSNKPEKDCKAEGLTCDSQCSLEGCWGPGPDQCLTCRNYQVENVCLENCDYVAGMYKAGPKVCMRCHEECESTCYGPGPGNCTRCKHVKDVPFCTVTCPSSKYNDVGECKPCHDDCVHGCTGPLNTIGSLGCNPIEKTILNGDVSVVS